MSTISSGRARKGATLAVALLLIAAPVAWWWQRQVDLNHLKIATGTQHGLYYMVGEAVGQSLENRLSRTVDVQLSDGSKENFERLKALEVDFAIVQGGSVPIQDVSVVTPLFREFILVIARKGTSIESVWDLRGKRVSLGLEGSGNRVAALKVLEHFEVGLDDLEGENAMPFDAMESDSSIQAAIVTAGIEHPKLKQLMLTHEYEIIPIRSAVAIELVHPFIRNVEVPRGLFAEHPAVPPEAIPTIATTAYLVCRNDASHDLVDNALKAIHEESMRLNVPTLIAREDVKKLTVTRLHPTAQRYFNPEDNLGDLVSVMESVVATKELLFAFGAGVYLIWMRWRRMKEKELEAQLAKQKEHLDEFLTETLRIEKEQARSYELGELQVYLDEVTRIKLAALKELTEEDLRGNQEFSIFLDQCSHLISRIQMKMFSIRKAGTG